MYDEVYEWSQVMNLPGPAQAVVKTSLAHDCGIIALDALVGNTDRNNGRNALFGLDPGSPAEGGFVFFDSANSLNMGDRWQNEAWKTVDVPPMPDVLRQAVDRDVLRDAVTRVAGIAEAVIDEIVKRIPDEYMASVHRDI